MTGCLCGRGETVISIEGLAWAKRGRVSRRKRLGGVSAGEERRGRRDALHALGAAGPVAVVEVETLALEDKGADAILPVYQQTLLSKRDKTKQSKSYLASRQLLQGFRTHFCAIDLSSWCYLSAVPLDKSILRSRSSCSLTRDPRNFTSRSFPRH